MPWGWVPGQPSPNFSGYYDTAFASFTNVPALTAIADVHIDNGNIASWTDFQGVVDLDANRENFVNVSPKGTKTRLDMEAEVTRMLVASASFQSQIIPKLIARVNAAMEKFQPIVPVSGVEKFAPVDSYDDALTAFLTFVDNMPKIITGSPTLIIDQIIGTEETTIRVATRGSILEGYEIKILEGAFPSGTRIRVVAATISSCTLSFIPISPLISMSTGGLRAKQPMLVKIPTTLPLGILPNLPLGFYSETGELRAGPTLSEASESITIWSNDFIALENVGLSGLSRIGMQGSFLGVYNIFGQK
ncbi:MAG: hypothetical protein WA705_31615 [Candidatus Ozemobacteraceae bacterium]